MTATSGGPATGAWTPHHREGRIAPVQEKEHDRPASLDHPRAPRRPRGVPYFENIADNHSVKLSQTDDAVIDESVAALTAIFEEAN